MGLTTLIGVQTGQEILVVKPADSPLSRARWSGRRHAMHGTHRVGKGSDSATTRRIRVVGSALTLVSASGQRGRGALRPHLHLHLRGHLSHLCHYCCIHHGARQTWPHVPTCRCLRHRNASPTPRHAATASSPLSAAPATPAAPPRCCCCRRRLCFIRRRRPPSAARPASFPVQRAHTPVLIIVIIAPCSVCPSPFSRPRVWRARWSCWKV